VAGTAFTGVTAVRLPANRSRKQLVETCAVGKGEHEPRQEKEQAQVGSVPLLPRREATCAGSAVVWARYAGASKLQTCTVRPPGTACRLEKWR